MKKDKRRHSRKLLRIEARYQDQGSKVLKGTVRNISLSGVFIETPCPLALQTVVQVSLDATYLGKVVDVKGLVVRIEPDRGMAVEFENKENRDIRLLLGALRKLDQASMLALSRSALGD